MKNIKNFREHSLLETSVRFTDEQIMDRQIDLIIDSNSKKKSIDEIIDIIIDRIGMEKIEKIKGWDIEDLKDYTVKELEDIKKNSTYFHAFEGVDDRAADEKVKRLKRDTESDNLRSVNKNLQELADGMKFVGIESFYGTGSNVELFPYIRLNNKNAFAIILNPKQKSSGYEYASVYFSVSDKGVCDYTLTKLSDTFKLDEESVQNLLSLVSRACKYTDVGFNSASEIYKHFTTECNSNKFFKK